MVVYGKTQCRENNNNNKNKTESFYVLPLIIIIGITDIISD